MIKTKIKAEIVGHSLNPQGDELISVLCTFPRIILAEVNTHRMLSKNTSSSRAIPFEKMVEAVQNNPFIPIAWQKEHKGMQGSEYITGDFGIQEAKATWLIARDKAIKEATNLNKIGITKQLCNRLLEPFMWTTMLITGSKEGWDNFFKLRCPVYYYAGNNKSYKSKKELLPILLNDFGEVPVDSFWYNINKGQAEIHMMALAEAVYDSVNESTPKQLKAGEWHIPFKDKIHIDGIQGITAILKDGSKQYQEGYWITEQKVKISTAMAAHTSYTIVGGEVVKSPEKWIELHDKLVAYDPPHSSPLEHVAQVPNQYEYDMALKEEEKGWFYNLKGFKSYRYIIEHQK